MSGYDKISDAHNVIEAFILKWTFIGTFTCATLFFIMKVLFLLSDYVSTGRLVNDLGKYIIQGIKSLF